MAAAAANANAISVEMSSNSQQAAPRSVPSESLPNMESIHVAYSKKKHSWNPLGLFLYLFVLFSCLFSLYLVFTPFSNNFAIAWAYFYSDYLPMKNRRSTKILTIQNR